MSVHGAVSRALCVACAAGLLGCWARQVGPPPDLPPARQVPRVALVLSVNDFDLEWGDGALGARLQQLLLDSGRLAAVHYPVVPRDPPPLRLDIRATGRVDGHEAWTVTASAVSGYFLMLPSLVLPLRRDFDLQATGVLLEDERPLTSFEVDGRVQATFGFYASPARVEARARDQLYAYLAARVLDALGRAAPP